MFPTTVETKANNWDRKLWEQDHNSRENSKVMENSYLVKSCCDIIVLQFPNYETEARLEHLLGTDDGLLSASEIGGSSSMLDISSEHRSSSSKNGVFNNTQQSKLQWICKMKIYASFKNENSWLLSFYILIYLHCKPVLVGFQILTQECDSLCELTPPIIIHSH